ncbi:helix-turn-helix domain-containing protein [Sphaerisporangium album]|uniref:GyrI-like domain-containing protein n=1 Tax=Sphaerisporangium album TaxID=509200 RepID=UPI0026BD28C4
MLERLSQAMEYIERHLDQQIEVAELARIAVTSEYHFRRLFSALAGIPLSEYVRRRRLTVAGAQVLAGEETLLDVAVCYGYSSGEAFARAFRAVHGIGPGEARRTGAALYSQPRMSFRLIIEGSGSMRYRVVEKEEFRVVGKKARVPLVHEGMNPAMVEFIRSIDQETVRRIAGLSDQEPQGIVSVADQVGDGREEGTELDYYHAVVTGADVPEDMDALDVRRVHGRCSRARARSRRRSSTCGGTCSRSGSRPTRTGAGRVPRSHAPCCRRTGPRRTPSCGSPWSGPRTEG